MRTVVVQYTRKGDESFYFPRVCCVVLAIHVKLILLSKAGDATAVSGCQSPPRCLHLETQDCHGRVP